MNIEQLKIADIKLITPKAFHDDRGYFLEVFTELKYFESLGVRFVQDNLSYSKYGTIRGLHFQRNPYAQAKLVRCVHGQILDVVVDLRKDSASFGMSMSKILSELMHEQLFVPVGFAHGFSVLSSEAIVEYKCSEYYKPSHDAGIYYNDPDLAIDWKVPLEEQIISRKDFELPRLQDISLYLPNQSHTISAEPIIIEPINIRL